MIFEFLDLKPRNPYLSLALDEALALFMGKVGQGEIRGGIRLWANPPAIIMGRTCKVEETVQPDLIPSLRLPGPSGHSGEENSAAPFLCRRSSGGGTVFHGPGNINFSLFFSLESNPRLFDIRNSYRIVLGMIQRALEVQHIQVELRGDSDLVSSNGDGSLKKVSGNAQFRKYGVLMHHGTLIIRNHLIESMTDYLKHPPKEPEYRQGREHREFLGSVPDTFDITAFYTCLSREMCQFLGEEQAMPLERLDRNVILIMARKLLREIYATAGWINSGQHIAGENSIRNKDTLERFVHNYRMLHANTTHHSIGRKGNLR